MAVGLRQFSGYLTLGEVWSSRCRALPCAVRPTCPGLGWEQEQEASGQHGEQRRGRAFEHWALKEGCGDGGDATPPSVPLLLQALRLDPAELLRKGTGQSLPSRRSRALLCSAYAAETHCHALSVSDGFTEDGVYSAPLRVIKTLGP